MASFTETTVTVRLIVERLGTDTRILAEATSYDQVGRVVRSARLDITDQLSAARKTGAASLMDDVVARVTALWEIA